MIRILFVDWMICRVFSNFYTRLLIVYGFGTNLIEAMYLAILTGVATLVCNEHFTWGALRRFQPTLKTFTIPNVICMYRPLIQNFDARPCFVRCSVRKKFLFRQFYDELLAPCYFIHVLQQCYIKITIRLVKTMICRIQTGIILLVLGAFKFFSIKLQFKFT